MQQQSKDLDPINYSADSINTSSENSEIEQHIEVAPTMSDSRDAKEKHSKSKHTNLTPLEAYANLQTWEHINLVMQLLSQVQIELIERQFIHDRSKLQSPEVEVFASVTDRLSRVSYGSDEYKQMLGEMKTALDHHYAHNRHHPEFFVNRGTNNESKGSLNLNSITEIESYIKQITLLKSV